MNDFAIEELERLKELLRTGKMERNKSNNFVDEDCFDDDTSKSEIYKQQFLFLKEASKFLDENFNRFWARSPPLSHCISGGMNCFFCSKIKK